MNDPRKNYRFERADKLPQFIEQVYPELCRHHQCIGIEDDLHSPSTPIPINRQRAPTCRLIAIREPISAHTGRFS